MQINLIVPGHVNTPSVIQRGMKNGDCIIFRHIDLIQNTESPILRTLIDTSLSQLHLVIHKSVRPDQFRTSCIYMEGNIVGRSSEDPGQILRQHIFSRSLGAGQQKIFSLQKSRYGHLQDFPSIKRHRRTNNPVSYLRIHTAASAKYFHRLYQFLLNALFFQKSQFFCHNTFPFFRSYLSITLFPSTGTKFCFIHNLFIYPSKMFHFRNTISSFLPDIITVSKETAINQLSDKLFHNKYQVTVIAWYPPFQKMRAVPGLSFFMYSLFLYFKQQIAVGRHRPHLLIHQHFQLIHRFS